MPSHLGFWLRTAPYGFLRDWGAAVVLVAACGCAASQVQTSRGAVRADAASQDGTTAEPVRLKAVVVQNRWHGVASAEKTLAPGEPLRADHDWAVRLISDKPMYFYVVLQHSDKRRALLYPQPQAPAPTNGPRVPLLSKDALVAPLPAGPVQLPMPGDWFSLFGTVIAPGDKLCVIASEHPTGQLSCTEDAQPNGGSRGEDQPPPPTPPPKRTKRPPPPPPPDDKDAARGGRTVITLPLAAR